MACNSGHRRERNSDGDVPMLCRQLCTPNPLVSFDLEPLMKYNVGLGNELISWKCDSNTDEGAVDLGNSVRVRLIGCAHNQSGNSGEIELQRWNLN